MNREPVVSGPVVSGPVVAGAVLCGGRSTRMGRDKAFVCIDGVPMARLVADALQQAGCAQVMAVGGDAAALEAIGLVPFADGWPGEGPVGGVLTALRVVVAADVTVSPVVDIVVVVACDTPWLDAATVSSIADALANEPLALAAVAHTDRLEPLCAAWRREALASVAAAFDGGERRLHEVLAAMPITTVDVSADALRNVNAPTDVPG